MVSKFSKINNTQEWRALLDKALFKTFFHSLEWEEFLEKEFKWLKFERYNWPAQGGQAKALLSLANIEGKKLISHPFCEYGGPLPLVPEIDGQEFKKDLLDEFKTPFKISFHPYLLKFFLDLKGESQRETYLLQNLNSQNTEQLWDNLDRNRRRSIKTALEQNFKIEKCQNTIDLQKLYHFYVKNLKKHGAPAYPFSFFDFFFKNSGTEILIVKDGKKMAGGNIFLSYQKLIHSFLCGFDEKYRKTGIHSLVIWSEIRKGQKNGYESLDLGATRKISSLADFKERWGGKNFPIVELKNYSGESKLRGSFLRDAWSWLPVCCIKKLSPRFLKYKL